MFLEGLLVSKAEVRWEKLSFIWISIITASFNKTTKHYLLKNLVLIFNLSAKQRHPWVVNVRMKSFYI